MFEEKQERRNTVKRMNQDLIHNGVNDRSERARIISEKTGNVVSESTLRTM